MKINRNIFWSEVFINELARCGVKYACIAPGSRSTSLTFATANNDQLKKYVFIDERSCAFFALGLAKSSKSPVLLICTSGTAVAEFYPAVIEAFQQMIPLIICTADRPPELIDNGTNQTIFQNGIYKNHIIWSFDLGIPEVNVERLKHIKTISKRAYYECCQRNHGPVHINFPFRKPFEPDSFTDEIDEKVVKIFQSDSNTKDSINTYISSDSSDIEFGKSIMEIQTGSPGIIIAGQDDSNDFVADCINLAEKLNYPIFADGASQFRYGSFENQHILSNFDAFIRSEEYSNKVQPSFILQFGRSVTSKGLESFLTRTKAKRYIINNFGKWNDPYNNSEAVIAMEPALFCKRLLQQLEDKNFKNNTSWLNNFIIAERISQDIKENIINNAPFPFEGRIINEIFSIIPENSSVMVSNSMPVRDLDYFAPKTKTNINVYSNRGASGIDGINSTALGIAADSKNTTFLITGDLAFYHDLNGLLASYKYSIPLIVILINNNGGGIFEMLPVSKHKDVFNEYFQTPHNLDFSCFVKGYGGRFENITSWDNLKEQIKSAIEKPAFSVFQIKTDPKESVRIRKHFWAEVEKAII